MTTKDWIRSNLPIKGDEDDKLPGDNDEVIIEQKTLDNGARIERVRDVDEFEIMFGDLVDDYRRGNIDKETLKRNAHERAEDPSSVATTLNDRDPNATDPRNWEDITNPQDEAVTGFWERMDREGRL